MNDPMLAAAEANLAKNPKAAAGWCGVAELYADRGRDDLAAELALEALRLGPNDGRVLRLWGLLALRRGAWAEAANTLRDAVTADPGHALAWSHLGHALKAERRIGEAVLCHREAARLRPDDPLHAWNLALALLMDGQWAEGWETYEARHRLKDWPRRPALSGPAWDGREDKGAALLVWAEQGLGDTIQFARWLQGARARVGRLELLCARTLGAVLGGIEGVDALVHRPEDATAGAFHVPLLSLPLLVGPAEPPPILASAPLLRADPARAETLSRALGGGPSLRIAVGYQGNPGYAADRDRSFPLAALRPLAGPGVRLLSVQKVHGLDQLAAQSDAIENWGIRLEVDGPPFAETMAFLSLVDVVITSDTALAHLSASLGRPTWVLLPFVPDWRWGLAGTSSPWYGSVRLFRQPRRGDWDAVVAAVGEELRTVAPERTLP
jgi:hypothetical protein